jgi:hypothetical protein
MNKSIFTIGMLFIILSSFARNDILGIFMSLLGIAYIFSAFFLPYKIRKIKK